MKLHIPFLLFLSLLPLTVSAQVNGVVNDANGEPLPGAHVRWIGSKNAVVTDDAGKFSISGQPRRRSLVASFVGYSNDTVEVVDATQPVVITMKNDLTLGEATVSVKRGGTYKSFNTIENVDLITDAELCRAACCNLGESFVTNPSVDVSYSDAATGAKQIRLLGLSGTYVQMLTENIPNFRGLAAPFGLGYVPGPWMQSIQVSKGSSSVKNGYEALTGQINVEYKKPQQADPDWLALNAYADLDGRLEGNADATFKMGDKWGTTILAHYENDMKMHDGNDDGFADKPVVEQFNFLNRWAYTADRFSFQIGAKVIAEQRESGQLANKVGEGQPRYMIDIATNRYEAFAKTAYIFNKERNTNMALMISGSFHNQDAAYGLRRYDAEQTSGYASLLFESDLDEHRHHSISAGLSVDYDKFDREYRFEHDALMPLQYNREDETTPGAYAQYTFNLHDKFVVMAGVRGDHSSRWGNFFTPRFHVKFTPNLFFNLRLSAGKGYRTARALDENNNLLAGSRKINITVPRVQEEAWNYGASAAFKIPAADKLINLNVEYYYTDFLNQLVADMDSDPHAVSFYGLNGRSYSQVVQAEISYPFFEGFTATAAYRYTDVRCTYNGKLRSKPLTNRYKALLTLSYKTPLELWQFDATLQLNGGGRMPDPYALDNEGTLSWKRTFGSYPQLSAQITRYFRQWSVYIGGENLTAYRQPNPIIDAANPWSDRFDPTMIYAPVHGAKIYIGARFNIPR